MVDAIIVVTNPEMPMMQDMGVQYLSVSLSVMPEILHTTQKPESFIQAIGLDPQPIATAR